MSIMIKKWGVLLLFFAYFLSVETDAIKRKENSCKRYNNVMIYDSLKVSSSATVIGMLTASCFRTPSGPFTNGLANYAVLSNQAEIASGGSILWTSTPAGNVSSDITFDTTTGLIALPTSGVFLIKYTVRVDLGLASPSTTVQLQQVISGTPVNITQPAMVNDVESGGAATYPASQTQITGYAIVTVTSDTNNEINLLVTFDPTTAVIPATSGTDANAQMAIIQLQ